MSEQPRNAEFYTEPEPHPAARPKRRWWKRFRRVDRGDHGGEFVSKEYADANPDTTEGSRVERKYPNQGER